MPEKVREDDQFRDPQNVNKPEPQIGSMPDNLRLDTDEVPFTDPTTQTVTKTYTVAAQTALGTVASTAAVTVDDENMTVTSVTYTPAGAQAAPAAGNSRTYTLTGSEGTIASYTFSNASAAYVNGTPIALSLGVTAIKEAETLNIAITVAGAGAVDPGGVLAVTYTI